MFEGEAYNLLRRPTQHQDAGQQDSDLEDSGASGKGPGNPRQGKRQGQARMSDWNFSPEKSAPETSSGQPGHAAVDRNSARSSVYDISNLNINPARPKDKQSKYIPGESDTDNETAGGTADETKNGAVNEITNGTTGGAAYGAVGCPLKNSGAKPKILGPKPRLPQCNLSQSSNTEQSVRDDNGGRGQENGQAVVNGSWDERGNDSTATPDYRLTSIKQGKVSQ